MTSGTFATSASMSRTAAFARSSVVPSSKSSTSSSSFLLSYGSILSGTTRIAARPIAAAVKRAITSRNATAARRELISGAIIGRNSR